MALVEVTTIKLRPGVKMADAKPHLSKACDLIRKNGAEGVTVGTIFGGAVTDAIEICAQFKDWSGYGKFAQASSADPEMGTLLDSFREISTWEMYISEAFLVE